MLTEDEFTYGGTTYRITQLYWIDGDHTLHLMTNQTQAPLAPLTLNVDGTPFRLTASGDMENLEWDYDPTPAWADGTTVALSLTAPASKPTTSSSGSSTGKRPIGVDLSTVSGWEIVDGVKKDRVGIIRLLPPPGSIPDKRVSFMAVSATYMAEGSKQFDFSFSVGRNGKVAYSGAALSYATDEVTLSVDLTDSKGKAAKVTLDIPIAVKQVQPPTLAASGAPYSGWSVTAGEASDNIGTVYGIAFDGDLVKFPRRPKFRYEIIQAVDLARAGDAAGPALLIGSKHAAFKIAKGTGVVSYTGERITGDQVRITIRVSDKKGLAAPIDVISLVSVTHTATSRPPGTPSPTQPDLRSFAERNPPPAVWRGPVHDACPAKPGYVNFGASPTIIDLQQPSPAPLLDPAERYVTVPATCNYVTDEAHREHCAAPSRWRKDFCRGWSPPYLTNSES